MIIWNLPNYVPLLSHNIHLAGYEISDTILGIKWGIISVVKIVGDWQYIRYDSINFDHMDIASTWSNFYKLLDHKN